MMNISIVKLIYIDRLLLFILVLFSGTNSMSDELSNYSAGGLITNVPYFSSVTISGMKQNITTSPIKKYLNKVNRKQYEIINMLWRKTKIFVDIENNTSKYKSQKVNSTEKTKQYFLRKNLQIPRPFPGFQTSTPSFIEFYYLHEIDESNKGNILHTDSHKMVDVKTKIDNVRLNSLRSVNAFYLFDRFLKTPQENVYKSFKTSGRTSSNKQIILNETSLFTLSTDQYSEKNENITQLDKLNKSISSKIFHDDPRFVPDKNKKRKAVHNSTANKRITQAENSTPKVFQYRNVDVQHTTTNDKVKFFEIYDSQLAFDHKESIDYIKIKTENKEEKKLLLEHLDFDAVQNNADTKLKHRKKHIIETNRNGFQIQESLNSVTMLNTSTKEMKTSSGRMREISFRYEFVPWLNYPFMAVYVYEPLQVYCDSASISQHWLIASASCLSRHHENPGGYGQSAFVTYCGDNWRQLERIAYVKYSIIHPKFRSHDRVRQQLYNIGLIRVINSMTSSCPDWGPISLMSHKFHANQNGSKAIAIGWGLDRYDSRYSSSKLPKQSLSVYEALLYSNDCPGNIGYRNSKKQFGDTGTNNIYCLSLPRYFGEENDPQHGSLLLIGGKLIGLYLQEERRSWGEQSAQYTGTWRLVPWVLDVAREPDEADNFNVDI
ncbi:uncharacterized protein LOC114251328 [Bombyx mandarina]|uniref:Uncharacterized protein LOC114251328 n=1 Tax=Bombyx mandarina TaxID=7092 RepID=A0A6J2KH43_BOMMA|nr:uncharacterized protein LOC114251328 [Bombyx mandarina]